MSVSHVVEEGLAFRQHLIACIAEDPARAYWESWVAALDRFVVEVGAAP